MSSRSSRESLKRRREGFQLSLHQYAEVKRHRSTRTESTQHATAAASYPADTYATGCTSLTPQEAYFASARSACGLGGRGGDLGAAATAAVVDGSSNAQHTVASTTVPITRILPSAASSGSGSAAAENELVLRLRPIRVDVVRGDTGRRSSFYLDSTFLYTWHRGNNFYHSLDGEQVGLELRETVFCHVSTAAAPPPPQDLTQASPFAYGAPPVMQLLDGRHHRGCDLPQHALLRNEEAACDAAAATAAVCDGTPVPSSAFLFSSPHASYSYEATQVSRQLAPLTRPEASSTDVVMAHLGSCSPALFVECLLKCVHDEAVLRDDQGWVYLYHGRHMVTEVGRTRLLHDLFTHAYFPPATSEGDPQGTLTVCVFRKH